MIAEYFDESVSIGKQTLFNKTGFVFSLYAWDGIFPKLFAIASIDVGIVLLVIII